MTDLQMQNPSHDSDVTRRWDDYVSAEGVRSLKYCLECLQVERCALMCAILVKASFILDPDRNAIFNTKACHATH